MILEKNLYGLDIDRRAAQLAAFCLMMKGRADDGQLFEKRPRLNVLSIEDSVGLSAALASQPAVLNAFGSQRETLEELIVQFKHANSYGSLIRLPQNLAQWLPELSGRAKRLQQRAGLFSRDIAQQIVHLVRQAELLARRFDVVVANPPYMGSNAMNPVLKAFVRRTYPTAKKDLFSCFIERGYDLARVQGYSAMVTLHNWMFIASLEKMRRKLLRTCAIRTLAHLGARAFESIGGEVVQTSAFVLQIMPPGGHPPVFVRLVDGRAEEKRKALLSGANRYCNVPQDRFQLIPGCQVSYWLGDNVYALYARGQLLSNLVETRIGLVTGDNDRFLRRWWEVDVTEIGFGMQSSEEAAASGLKWFPLNKGGAFRRWFGNLEYVINWQHDAQDIRNSFRIRGWDAKKFKMDHYFQKSLSWSDVGTGPKGFRCFDAGFVHNNVGHSAIRFSKVSRAFLAGYCNTPIVETIVNATNPTLHFGIGDFGRIPCNTDMPTAMRNTIERNVRQLVAGARKDWNAYETAWEFEINPLVRIGRVSSRSLEECFLVWEEQCRHAVVDTKAREEQNNRLFIRAYDLEGEVSPEVPDHRVTLYANPAYRYRNAKQSLNIRFRQDTMAELVSYAVGCMMGRYSLDTLGLVYAKSAGQGFEAAPNATFTVDDDGIVPITPDQYFEDDIVARLAGFLATVWKDTKLDRNLSFLADSLTRNKAGTKPRETPVVSAAPLLYFSPEDLPEPPPFTGFSPAARYGRFSAWCTYTVTMRAHWLASEHDT